MTNYTEMENTNLHIENQIYEIEIVNVKETKNKEVQTQIYP